MTGSLFHFFLLQIVQLVPAVHPLTLQYFTTDLEYAVEICNM